MGSRNIRYRKELNNKQCGQNDCEGIYIYHISTNVKTRIYDYRRSITPPPHPLQNTNTVLSSQCKTTKHNINFENVKIRKILETLRDIQ